MLLTVAPAYGSIKPSYLPHIFLIMSNNHKEALLPHKPDPALLEAFRYIDEMPGKNVRGTLIDCFQLWMNVESSDVLNSIKVRA